MDLSEEQAKALVKQRDFFDSNWNKQGRFANNFMDNGDGTVTVTDRASGLMWQKGGSSSYMPYAQAQEYVDRLNRDGFAGHRDWRLPTLEEGASLLEPTKRNDLNIDPVFDGTQWWIWTADRKGSGSAWHVGFDSGYVHGSCRVSGDQVRVCRALGQ